MQVLSNATVAIMDAESAGYRLAAGASIAIDGDRIAWVGTGADLPAALGMPPPAIWKGGWSRRG